MEAQRLEIDRDPLADRPLAGEHLTRQRLVHNRDTRRVRGVARGEACGRRRDACRAPRSSRRSRCDDARACAGPAAAPAGLPRRRRCSDPCRQTAPIRRSRPAGRRAWRATARAAGRRTPRPGCRRDTSTARSRMSAVSSPDGSKPGDVPCNRISVVSIALIATSRTTASAISEATSRPRTRTVRRPAVVRAPAVRSRPTDRACAANRGTDPDGETRQQRDHAGEQQDAPVDGQAVERRDVRRVEIGRVVRQVREQPSARRREADGHAAAKGRKHEVLDEELHGEARSSGTERRSHRQLVLPRRRSRRAAG